METKNRRWQTIVFVILLLGMIGSLVWGVTQKSRADQLAAEKETAMEERDDARAAVEELTTERDTALASLEEANAILNQEPPSIIIELKAAFESGEYEQVRALFADDGFMMTDGDIHYALAKDALEGYNHRVDEGEFYRLAVFHGRTGSQFIIKDWIARGKVISFNFKWEGSIGGNMVLHLRSDGKIVAAIISRSDRLPVLSFVDHRPYDPGD